MGMNNDKFSNELNRLLAFIEDKLVAEHPTPIVTLEYFVLGVFDQKDSFIYKVFYDNMLSSALDTLHEAYYHLVSQKALTAIRPNREIKYDYRFQKALEDADREREKLGAEKITSEHVFLAILADNREDNKIKRVFEKAAVSYSILFEKIKTKQKMEDTNTAAPTPPEKPTPPEQPQPGNKQTIIEVRATGENPRDIVNAIMNGFGGLNNQQNQQQSQEDNDALTQYCVNLNEQVKKGKIDKLVGRQKELDAIVRVLGRRKKNNAILVGDGGVGKTAIIEGLAYLIENGHVPPVLYGKKILSLNMTALMSGTTLRGMFEERVNALLSALANNPQYLLVIDNIDSTLGAKNGTEDFGLAAMLSHALDGGEIQVIGTADFKGYRNTFDKDPSLGRKFQKIIVEPSTREETLEILNNVKTYYENFHRVVFEDDAITACVELADKYITERRLPDSAIDILDEVGSNLSPNNKTNDEIDQATEVLKEIQAKIDQYKRDDDYDAADELTEDENKAKLHLIEVTKKYDEEVQSVTVTKDDILSIISVKTGVPISRMTTDDKTRIATMDERIKKEVIGQDEAVDAVCKALKRNRIGLKNGRTYGAFLFLGGTGRGKSLLAKKLAKEVFGDESDLVRFDMSEYMDKTSVNKLIGANPGYVGYEEGGLMTEQIKNKKHCVILLDEIEKADPEVYNIFLQVFDEGFLTDNSGQKVDFKNTIIILTSNAGAKAASDFGKGIGFTENEDKNTKKILMKKLKNRFPPEFLNRLDDIIYFNKLTDDNMKEIVKLELGKLQSRAEEIGHKVEYDDTAVVHILDNIKDESEFGARPIIRAIENEYEDKITDLLLTNEYEGPHTFHISCFSDNEVSVV